MTDKILQNIKKSVRDIPGYQPPPFDCTIKMNQNENPFPLPLEYKKDILAGIEAMDWGRYPECSPQELQERLGEHLDFSPEGIIAGNGSNEIIQALTMATLSARETLLTVQPTFSLYRHMGAIMEARVVEVPLKKDYTYNTEAILEAVHDLKPRLMIFASPNNPTGNLLSREDVQRIAAESTGFVAVDEAYIEFSGDRRGCIDLIADTPNILVTRTYSKAMNAAGLRLGYMLARDEVAAEIRKVMLPYTLGKMSRYTALKLIELRNILDGQIDAIKMQRDFLYDSLKTVNGIKIYPSEANFLLMESLKMPAVELYNALMDRGILIRNVSSYPMLSKALRISVGTRDENTAFITAVKEIIQ